MKFFQQECRFPENPREIPSAAINHIALQAEVPFQKWQAYQWTGRTIKYHRAKIREWFGYREANRADVNHLKVWLIQQVLDHEHRMDRLQEAILGQCQALSIEPPATEQIRRLIRSAAQNHENHRCNGLFQGFDQSMPEQLDALIAAKPLEEDETGWSIWQDLTADPGKAGLESVKKTASRLRLIRELQLLSKPI